MILPEFRATGSVKTGSGQECVHALLSRQFLERASRHSPGLHSGPDCLIFLEIPLECRALAVFLGRDSLSHPLRETD